MAAEGLCWCASEAKCPHGISARLPVLWEDMEKVRYQILRSDLDLQSNLCVILTFIGY